MVAELLPLLPLLPLLLSRCTVRAQEQGPCGALYRSLDGSCSNAYMSSWGRAGQYLDPSPLPAAHSSPLGSQMLADEPERQEPVTEWLGAWTGFIKADLLEVRDIGRGIVNVATPVLDLSNLYGTTGGDIKINPKLMGEDQEAGSRILWRLLQAEQERLAEDLRQLNHGWGSAKIEQESRRILIAEYQNIILKEVAPLLLGFTANQLTQVGEVTYPATLASEELLVGLHSTLAMGTSELEDLGPDLGSRLQTTDGWTELAKRLLNIRLIIPGGGITMDRLSELTEALDLMGRVHLQSWSQVRSECNLEPTDRHAVKRAGKPVEQIEPLLGGLAEELQHGSILSPTLSCLLGKLLYKIVQGDSYWYTKESSQGFRRDQIETLNQVTLATLLCENIPSLTSIQPSAFLLPNDNLNHQIPCGSVPRLDLNRWISHENELDYDEEREIEAALAAAADNLLKFRKFEYSLFEDNWIAPERSSMRAEGSVTRPSVLVQNKANDSIMFEFVTYEFLKRPRLTSLVKHQIAPRRKKRTPHTFDIIVRDFYDQSNTVLNNRIKTMLSSLPQGHAFYTTVSVKNTVSNSISTPETTATQIVTMGKCIPAEAKKKCDPGSKYRSYTGHCNNLNNPTWGESNTPHRRLVPAEYDDGISTPRSKSVRGSPLPNPRTVSTNIHTSEQLPDPKYTLMLMQWGQLIDHDLTQTPMVRGHDNSILDCKSCSSNRVHPSCFPIPIPDGDNFYAFNRVDPKCIPFTRSMAGQDSLGPREQLNQLTAYIDGGVIYGSDECAVKQLKEPNSYYLKTFPHPLSSRSKQYKPLCPRTKEHKECFSPTGECFLAGDARVNEHPGLAVMHTLLVREHNVVAEKLAKLNPHWDSDKVFEETRRILAAEIQHITYNEFLPRVLGLNSLKTFDLELETSGYYYRYDPECSAASFNEFATAAFRFGHSTIRPNLTVMSEQALIGRAEPKNIALRAHFNNPDVVMEQDMVDDLLRGLLMSPMETMDNRVTDEVTNHLFEERGKPLSGMDLVSLNIQRARDHGIPGYNKYREICKLNRASTFLDFKDEMSLDMIYRMQRIYKHPDDVDLFSGLLSENRLNGALTGPTLACIIGLQFSHARKCDRFWYETGDPLLRFTEDQLREIRQTSMAGFLCRNMDANSMVPRSAMDQMDRLTNPLVDCEQTIKHLDVAAWKDEPSVSSSGSSSFSSGSSFSSSTSESSSFSSSSTSGSSSSSFSQTFSGAPTTTTFTSGFSSHSQDINRNYNSEQFSSGSNATPVPTFQASDCHINGRLVRFGASLRISPCTSCTCTQTGSVCEKIDLYGSGYTCLSLVKEFGIQQVENDASCRPQCRIL